MHTTQSTILVVDDNEDNREVLAYRLEQLHHTVVMAENGREALAMIRAHALDLVLLDIMMPELNGYQVLEQLKADGTLRRLPVIVISALNDMSSIVRCVELGAEDYLFKPFNATLLKARVHASLEKKRWRDQEQAYLRQIQIEQEKSERLLLNIMPKAIADRLKQDEGEIADYFEDVTVMFADLVGFTSLSTQTSAGQLVQWLNEIFSVFDALAEHYHLEKIKTIGDAYMVVGGLPTPQANHTQACADMALAMLSELERFNLLHQTVFALRIGIHTGPVVAGVIGTTKLAYDLWGDTVNTASRMESHGSVGNIQVSAITYERLRDQYVFEARGLIEVKGKGAMQTYLLKGTHG